MKIIFDSEEEKEKVVEMFTGLEGCPSDIGLKDNCDDAVGACGACWRAALESVEKKRSEKMKINKGKIHIILAKKCMTTGDLARLYGASRSRINVILNSQRILPATAGRIAKVLEIDVNEIIGD